jgi:hypothetical protein
MNTLNVLIWLFPVLFMIHDFEEIIVVGVWKEKYAALISSMNKDDRKAPFSDYISADSFSCAVAEEFILFSAAALIGVLWGNYIAWFGFFFGVFFHFLIHVYLSVKFGHYVPGLVTSIPFFLISCWIIWKAIHLMPYSAATLLITAVVGFAVSITNLIWLHKLMPVFYNWLQKYRKSSK